MASQESLNGLLSMSHQRTIRYAARLLLELTFWRLSLSESNTYKADLLLLTVTLLAAISWIFSKEAVQLMPPLLFLSLRFFCAGLLLALIAIRQFAQLTREQIFQAVRVGMVFAAGMSCWIMGLKFGTHVGEGAFLTSLGVVLVPVIGRLVFAERPPASTWLALPIAIAGLALLSLENGLNFAAGQSFYVIAAVLFAIYFNLNTRAANLRTVSDQGGAVNQRAPVPAMVLTAMVLMTVGAISGALSLLLEPWRPTFENFTGEIFMWVALSAVVGSSARFLLQTYAQSLSTQSHGVVIMVLEPVWTALIASVWFGEEMSLMQVIGCALIFTALLAGKASALRKFLRRA